MAAPNTRHIEPLLPTGAATRAFERPGFQDSAFQKLEPDGAYQFSAFDDEGFQSDDEVFQATAFQGDGFEIDEGPALTVIEIERPVVVLLQAVNTSSVW